MHDRRKPTLSAGDPDIREQDTIERGPIFREPPDRNSEEPSLVFWAAAIALGILLGGLGVKLITNWYESRQAEAVVRQFVAAMTGVNATPLGQSSIVLPHVNTDTRDTN